MQGTCIKINNAIFSGCRTQECFYKNSGWGKSWKRGTGNWRMKSSTLIRLLLEIWL